MRKLYRPGSCPITLALALCCALLVLAAGCGSTPAARQERTYGDPRAGLSAYKFAGCAQCHAIANVSVGREDLTVVRLDGEGNKRSASWLRAMLPAHLRKYGITLPPRDREDLVSYLAGLR